ncbi:MAG: hypothetical protein AAFU55_02680, partial [Pseudomonadota bacterium]
RRPAKAQPLRSYCATACGNEARTNERLGGDANGAICPPELRFVYAWRRENENEPERPLRERRRLSPISAIAAKVDATASLVGPKDS